MVLVWSIIALLPTVVANDDNGCSIYTNGVCLPKGYNKHMRPSEKTAMTVKISVRLEQILAINDVMSEIDFVTILGISWKEHRFLYSNDTETRQQSTSIPLNNHWVDYMWTPDLYIYQMRAVSTPELLQHPYTGARKYPCTSLDHIKNKKLPSLPTAKLAWKKREKRKGK